MVLTVFVGVNGDDDLLSVAWNGLNSGVEAERVLVRKSKRGEKLN
jgi:hypothetical protein